MKKKLKGTKFQIKVWKEILKIPKGKTKSYKEIAAAIGKPKSSRAVANACGKNPYPVEIPCHRVIRSNGEIGGYSGGGSKLKRILLSKEI
jgi:methylated-DNA-[protein]-cysteine S-methyltransferase